MKYAVFRMKMPHVRDCPISVIVSDNNTNFITYSDNNRLKKKSNTNFCIYSFYMNKVAFMEVIIYSISVIIIMCNDETISNSGYERVGHTIIPLFLTGSCSTYPSTLTYRCQSW